MLPWLLLLRSFVQVITDISSTKTAAEPKAEAFVIFQNFHHVLWMAYVLIQDQEELLITNRAILGAHVNTGSYHIQTDC